MFQQLSLVVCAAHMHYAMEARVLYSALCCMECLENIFRVVWNVFTCWNMLECSLPGLNNVHHVQIVHSQFMSWLMVLQCFYCLAYIV